MSDLTRGCVVRMKETSGLVGYGNEQCVSSVCEPLGTLSLFGHNQHYKIYDVAEIVERPLAKDAEIARLESRLRDRQNAVDHAVDYGKRKDTEIAELKAAIEQFWDLMAESYGVSELHLNGDIAAWDWLLDNEWLSKLAALKEDAAIAAVGDKP